MNRPSTRPKGGEMLAEQTHISAQWTVPKFDLVRPMGRPIGLT